MSFKFALINEVPANHSALAAKLTLPWLTQLADALTSQLRNDAAPIWKQAQGGTVRVIASHQDLAADEIPFRIVTALPDAPGAIAYHDVNGNAPDAFLGLDTCSTIDDVSVAASHEVLETIGDPQCDQWVANTDGFQYALELCDAVESNSYAAAGTGIRISDFLLPSFFEPGKLAASYTFLQQTGRAAALPAGPLMTPPGGYQLRRNADGSGETQVLGLLSPRRRARARKPTSRLYRRGLRHHPATRTAFYPFFTPSRTVAFAALDAGPKGPVQLELAAWQELVNRVEARGAVQLGAGGSFEIDQDALVAAVTDDPIARQAVMGAVARANSVPPAAPAGSRMAAISVAQITAIIDAVLGAGTANATLQQTVTDIATGTKVVRRAWWGLEMAFTPTAAKALGTLLGSNLASIPALLTALSVIPALAVLGVVSGIFATLLKGVGSWIDAADSSANGVELHLYGWILPWISAAPTLVTVP